MSYFCWFEQQQQQQKLLIENKMRHQPKLKYGQYGLNGRMSGMMLEQSTGQKVFIWNSRTFW